MTKTNFTKVEEALNEGLRKMTASHLLEMADSSAKTGGVTSNPFQAAIKRLIALLKHDLKQLEKQDPDFYQNLGLKKPGLKKLLSDPEHLTPEDWESIKQIKEKIDQYKQKTPAPADEQIIQKERRKHINKRFNINEKWLPLK